MSVYELDLGDEHRITFHENDPTCSKIIVCFAPQGGGMGPVGFGASVCIKNGWNYIYVGKAQQTKFRSLSLETFYDAVARVVDGKDVVSYGSSAGGYAALYYGGAIDARILSACPRNSQHPLHYRPATIKRLGAEKINELKRGFYHTPDLKDCPISKFSPTIVYDERQPKDRKTVEKWVLPAYPDATLINIPNSGHKPLEMLKQAGSLTYLLNSFVAGESIENDRLRFPEGTLNRQLDDGVLAFNASDFTRAGHLLNVEMATLRKKKLFSVYLDSVVQSGAPELVQSLKERVDAGDVMIEALSPRSRSKVNRILG
ncbi:alpha/beta fold hydrolase [Pseudooceanicola algae]|nr:hypothetical protein [Pseudooceanicola algae]